MKTHLDPEVRPQDDFYRHVNGAWLDSHVIPPDRASDGAFFALRDQSEKQTRAIAEDAVAGEITGTEAQRISVLYQQFMDEEELNRLGRTPIAPLLDMIRRAADHQDLAQTLGVLERIGAGGWFHMGVFADLNDTTKYVAGFEQGGLGLPDESYYREEDYAAYRDKYVEHVAKVLELIDFTPDPQEAAVQVMAFETALASHHWDVVKSRDVEAQNNPRSWAQVVAENPGFDFPQWDQGLGIGLEGKNLNVGQPDFMKAASDLWAETDLLTLKYWLARQVADTFAPYLDDAMAEEAFDFYGRTLSGTEEMRPRWKRALSLVESVVGFDMGRLYVQRHFPAEYKKQMQKLVDNLLQAYRDSITDLDWMTAETKEKALEKLGTFMPKIGYPENPRDYAGLQISADKTLVDNLMAAAETDMEWEFAKLGRPVDRTEWLMTPQTVNAYYYPSMNEIVFPAAILQPPFFDPEADDAVNYAAIGAVIGHEIGHGFDDQGSQFNAEGELKNWWTDQDRAEFEARTKALIDQYDQFSPAALGDEHKVNGALTIGENIGDLGGLTIAWKAWQKALEEQGIADPTDAPLVQDMEGPERFFSSWARIWRGKFRDDYAVQLLAVDPHSPAEFRCNGVLANFDAFADYYGVAEGDELWIAPEDRVRIW